MGMKHGIGIGIGLGIGTMCGVFIISIAVRWRLKRTTNSKDDVKHNYPEQTFEFGNRLTSPAFNSENEDLGNKSTKLKPTSSSLTDGNDESCDDDAIYSVQLTWQIEYQISWIRIVYRAPGLLSNMSLKLGQNNCENQIIDILDNSTADIYCNVEKLYTNLTLSWNERITICSIYVNGGRNVALKQTAVQSSTYMVAGESKAKASNAVDGDPNSNFNGGSCTHTAVNPISLPQWSVSFSSPQLVHRYVLYNRNEEPERLKGFILQSYSADNALVYNYTDSGNTLSNYTVTTVGKEVLKVTINATQILTLCEVEIYGERICAPGYFGLDCDQQCRCSDTSETCMSITGGCLSGCLSGYYGQGCQMECSPKKWGVDCLKTCSPFCRHPEDCSRTNGSCYDGCQAGYGGPTCIDECPAGRWGYNCANTCSEHCASASLCDKRTGNCSSGCSAGYLGDMCDMECDNLTFGLNCLENCSINCGGDGKCDIVSGYCLQGCMSKYGGDVCDQLIQENATESVAIIIPVVLVAIITVLIIGAVVILLKRKKIKEKSVETPDKVLDNRRSLETTHSAGETVNAKVLNKSSDNEVKIENKYVLIESIDGSIAAHQLAAFLHTRDKGYFDEQFKKIPAPENVSTAIGLSEKNKHKNRYKNICTYDHSRVHLDINEKKNEGDYINASYIQGYNSEDKFIASQGPNSIIINDFVRMLWEQKVDKVVMLTNLIEEGKVKCDRYWPEDGKMMFGDIKVKLAVTHVFADYTIRRLLLSKKSTEVQQVIQFHFTSWPDKGVPITPWALVDFEQRVAFNPTSRPVVVHCSAGVGRTGTFIALRNVMREAEETGRVNFLQTVARLRQDRMNMVQTAEQYEFLHKAAQVAITCIGTTITAYDVDVKVQHLLDKSVSGKTNLENEFNSVCAVSADLQTAGKEEEKELKVYENNQDVDLMRRSCQIACTKLSCLEADQKTATTLTRLSFLASPNLTINKL
ncbi:uncharacterized protein LOC131953868 [Physella acuta]|uniref:uncharacterized protein LOC131953868 n=1 Tax=Physella acuta TaxID=109671 RepID=UPI0027DBD8E1|nr:uncharacterized protein LOC131953868 [Physella acuta]